MKKEMPDGSGVDSAELCAVTSGAGQIALLLRDRRGDRLDHGGGHFELRDAIPDVVAPGDPFEIGPHCPEVAIVVLRQQQPHRPVEPGVRIGRDELGAERRIAEYQQRRRPELDSRVGRELRLIDLAVELYSLGRDIGPDAADLLMYPLLALVADDSDVDVVSVRGAV